MTLELARLLDHSVLKPEATEADLLAGASRLRLEDRLLLCAAVLGQAGLRRDRCSGARVVGRGLPAPVAMQRR
jgi:hypothetical protein